LNESAADQPIEKDRVFCSCTSYYAAAGAFPAVSQCHQGDLDLLDCALRHNRIAEPFCEQHEGVTLILLSLSTRRSASEALGDLVNLVAESLPGIFDLDRLSARAAHLDGASLPELLGPMRLAAEPATRRCIF
jgi:hypothetical protein